MYSTVQKFSLLFGLSLIVFVGIIATAWCPLLPNEFSDRGNSESTTGLVIASDEVANILSSVLFMRIQNVKHRRYSFCIGACSLGILYMIFGQLMFIRSNTVFVILSIVVRISMGVAISSCFCSGSSLFLSMFTEDAGKIFSFISMSLSVGFILGAPIGSILYGIGGFSLPFLLVGSCQVILSIITFFILPTDHEKLKDAEKNTVLYSELEKQPSDRTCSLPQSKHINLSYDLYDEKQPLIQTHLLPQTKNSNLSSDWKDDTEHSTNTDSLSRSKISEKVTAFQFLTNPGVISLSLAVTITASTIGFFFVGLGPLFLAEFQIPSEKNGLYFLPFTITRALSAPVLGYITDLGYGNLCLTLFGCALSAVSLTILGVTGFAYWLNNIVCIEILLAIIGIGSNGATVPFVKLIRKVFQNQSGNVDWEVLDSHMAAMYNICTGCGFIIGESIIGGFVLQYCGFYYTCLINASLCAVTGIISVLYLMKHNLMLTE